MRSLIKGFLALAIPLLAVTNTSVSLAQDVDTSTWLKVKPGRCIALRQGQKCYQRVSFSWQVPKQGKFCLVQVGKEQPIVCWSNHELQSTEVLFENKNRTRFELQRKPSNIPLAYADVEVAWVYKSTRSRTGWRLF